MVKEVFISRNLKGITDREDFSTRQWCRAHHRALQLAPCLDLDHVDLPAWGRPQARQTAERHILAPELTVLDGYSRPGILAAEDKAPRRFPSSTQVQFYVKSGYGFM